MGFEKEDTCRNREGDHGVMQSISGRRQIFDRKMVTWYHPSIEEVMVVLGLIPLGDDINNI